MVKKLIELDLPKEIWNIIDSNFRLNRESDSEILCNIIRNHVAEHGFYPDIDSLGRGQGVKYILDIQNAMIMSLIELLEKKEVATYKEWGEIMQQKMINNVTLN